MLFALLYYAFSGRKWFKGPRVNVEHIIHGVPFENDESPPNETNDNAAEKKLEN
jgi:hypothetical protein